MYLEVLCVFPDRLSADWVCLCVRGWLDFSALFTLCPWLLCSCRGPLITSGFYFEDRANEIITQRERDGVSRGHSDTRLQLSESSAVHMDSLVWRKHTQLLSSWSSSPNNNSSSRLFPSTPTEYEWRGSTTAGDSVYLSTQREKSSKGWRQCVSIKEQGYFHDVWAGLNCAVPIRRKNSNLIVLNNSDTDISILDIFPACTEIFHSVQEMQDYFLLAISWIKDLYHNLSNGCSLPEMYWDKKVDENSCQDLSFCAESQHVSKLPQSKEMPNSF